LERKPEAQGTPSSEIGSRKSEVRNQKPEAGGRKPEFQVPREEVLSSQEPVHIPIEDSIDLHTFSPREIKVVLEEYLREAYEKGFHTVRIVHGRGMGVQREIVRSVLLKHPLVVSFKDARPEAGGWGATAVVLKEQ
jgi:DNA-nicking Smr family endonuclease